ncbi:Hpt domain-containing protein [Pseudoduganella albidiflava]|uniref:Hpt domain-containing protein n=1 Tax=Pseudoduganella albidiflava TaxID=321983 RepID=UPI0013F14D92|nr:Hpt domain-containing protein [Pseudoduganella albidiflava]
MQAGMAVPVLDIERGIARLMGNSGIYFSALKRFATHMEAARAVAAQLAQGDHAGACRAIHTLRGAAGLLCAGEVHAVAGELETALAHGHAAHALLDELDVALRRVQACIAVAVPKDSAAPAPPVPQATMRNVPELLDRLGVLLDEGNSAALDMLEKYGTVLEKVLDSAAWETIMAAAQEYDFERAFAALQAARSAGIG